MKKYAIAYTVLAIVCAMFAILIALSFIQIHKEGYQNPVAEAIHWALIGIFSGLFVFFAVDTYKEIRDWRYWVEKKRKTHFIHSRAETMPYEQVLLTLRDWRLLYPGQFTYGNDYGMNWIKVKGIRYTTNQDSWMEYYSDYYGLSNEYAEVDMAGPR